MERMFPEVKRARALLKEFNGQYWFAGGWAVDLFLGRKTREHKDIEIAIARDDQRILYGLSGLDHIDFIEDRTTRAWDGSQLDMPIHEFRCHFKTGEVLEVLLNEFDGKNWLYRRNFDIKAPKEIFPSRKGTHLPMEIVMLFKSVNMREIDQRDFACVVGVMDHNQKLWLRDALLRYGASNHPWLAFL